MSSLTTGFACMTPKKSFAPFVRKEREGGLRKMRENKVCDMQ